MNDDQGWLAIFMIFVVVPSLFAFLIYLFYGLTKDGPDGPWPFKRPW